MDGVESRAQVIVVAATNRLDIIDTAILRPGRFDRLIYVPTPNQNAREQIFKINTIKMQLQADSDGKPLVDFVKLAQNSEGMSGAEICLICREAGLMALTEDFNIEKTAVENIFVKQAHLEKALHDVKNRGK